MSKQAVGFCHNGTIGDIWASLPSMKEYYNKFGVKPILYLVNGQAAKYYDGATHPTRDKDGVMVMLNEEMIRMIIPLVKAQPYIEDCRVFAGEKIGVDLNEMRNTFVNMPFGDLRRWYFYVFPDLATDLSTEYISVPDTDKDFSKGKIIVARTERYTNDKLNYSFLKRWEDDVLFAGTMKEYNLFCMEFGLNVKKLFVNDFLELAQAVKQCRGLISNQTMIFQIAEGMKTPRACELCSYAPNVIPIGANAFDFYAQYGLEYYFHVFNGTEELFFTETREKIKKPTEAGLKVEA